MKNNSITTNKTNNKNMVLLSVVTGLTYQILSIISGFIIPKLVLNNFGSEANGLVSSLSQFIGYVSLLEGGATGVVLSRLYKPINKKDEEKISSIIKTADSFFRKIALVVFALSIVVGLVYSFILEINFSPIYVLSLSMILSLNQIILYGYTLTYRTVVQAEGKIYLISISQIVILVLTIVFSLISVYIYPSIHILKFIAGVLYVIQPLIFKKYVINKYSIDKSVELDKELIESRWDGFSSNIAAFIHYSTDVVVLTFFTNLYTVSVYSVYSLVSSALSFLVKAINDSFTPVIGKAYAEGNNENINKELDLYENINFIIVFVLFTVASLLITPFVMIYTKNITDTNYCQPLFGYLIILSEGLYLIKQPHLDLSYSAGKFKEIKVPSYIEAGLNIIVSVVLVKELGLIGVALGTIVGMSFRMIFQVDLTSRIINRDSNKIFYKKMLVFLLSLLIVVAISVLISKIEYNIISWLLHGLIYVVVALFIFIFNFYLFFRKDFNNLITMVLKK